MAVGKGWLVGLSWDGLWGVGRDGDVPLWVVWLIQGEAGFQCLAMRYDAMRCDGAQVGSRQPALVEWMDGGVDLPKVGPSSPSGRLAT